MQHIEITKPDDWHNHFRDGSMLNRTVADCAHRFGRAIAMPNLVPPITTVQQAQEYQQRIHQHIPSKCSFQPLMTLYLTDQMTATDIAQAKASGLISAIKLYPAGATTHSAAGVNDLKALYPTLEAMETHDIPLLIHGEVTDEAIDIFDRERVFIEKHLAPLSEHFPGLRIVLEHITTQEAVEFITATSDKIAATITAHHLLLNRNDLLVGGIKPDYFCLPILKRRKHQNALINAATSGNPKFFLGTDSAPHTQTKKYSVCGCAGVYTAHAAVELYAEIFDDHHRLDKLEDFASHFGADFYRLPRNQEKITLEKTAWTVPDALTFGNESLTPLRAGEQIAWRIKG